MEAREKHLPLSPAAQPESHMRSQEARRAGSGAPNCDRGETAAVERALAPDRVREYA
jgi:hypothetical protein